MASQKFGFVTLDPVSGSGSQAVNVSGDVYTGRVIRTKTFNISAEGVTSKMLTVNQTAAQEFVSVDSQEVTAAKTGGTITVSGKSNSSKLTFSVAPDGTTPLNLVLPQTYTAGGAQTSNGQAIADDPGATGEFNWSIEFTDIPENVTVDELLNSLTVTANGGQSKVVTIKQSAGDPYLNLDKETITLDVNGTAQTVNVDTNVHEWTWSEAVGRALRAVLGK